MNESTDTKQFNKQLSLHALTLKNLEVFRDLLGSTDFGGCFCAVWTSYGADWEARCSDQAQPNFFNTSERVKAGEHIGYLVYEDDQLVGWSGAGPKTGFPLLKTKLGSRLSEVSNSVWSIGCIAIKSEHRGRKLADQIVATIVDKAFKSGAIAVEAYPVRPFHEPRVYRGTQGLYERAGFNEIGFDQDGEYQILLMRARRAKLDA